MNIVNFFKGQVIYEVALSSGADFVLKVLFCIWHRPLKQPTFYDTIARLVGTRFGKPNVACAEVAKLVDALDLGSSVLRRESSSLSFRTI